MSRTIIIGDIHGCYHELLALLRKARLRPDDRLISVGDLICKGPNSRAVLDWAMKTRNLQVVVGNHEYRFLKHWKKGMTPDEKSYDLEVVRQMGRKFDVYMRYIASWPAFVLYKDLIVVHAGFDPQVPIMDQPVSELVNLRRLGKAGIPWYELYDGERLVVFGHWVKKRPVFRDNAVGLDTGCVNGGALTALILPERRLVSVRARRKYRKKESWI
ncbi:MAG: metallophosphoesterase [Elusimicrobiota bacterium]